MKDIREEVRNALEEIRRDYIQKRKPRLTPDAPLTESDLQAEIFCKLKKLCVGNDLYVHSEMAFDKPTKSKFDIVIIEGEDWIKPAENYQGNLKKGNIESRFSHIPDEYFHTIIEIKVQSFFPDAKKDIDKLADIKKRKGKIDCFFVLLNERGKSSDHAKIRKYAKENNVDIIEYTSQKSSLPKSGIHGRKRVLKPKSELSGTGAKKGYDRYVMYRARQSWKDQAESSMEFTSDKQKVVASLLHRTNNPFSLFSA
jgi:hypothetical protein